MQSQNLVLNFEVVVNKNLTFANHITQQSDICFMHISDLCQVCAILGCKVMCTIATSIDSKLD